MNKIKLNNFGIYTLTNAYYLYVYGKKLMNNKQTIEADICFEKCFALDSNHEGTCFQMLKISLSRNDYETALTCIERLYAISNGKYLVDYNLYLLLLSELITLPFYYQEMINNFTIADIKSSANEATYDENNLILAIYQGKYLKAYHFLKAINRTNNLVNGHNYILSLFLSKIITKETINYGNFEKFAKDKDYEYILSLLEKARKKRSLTPDENDIYELVNELIRLELSENVLPSNIKEASTIHKAIGGKNYKLALDLCYKYESYDLIYLLLKDIYATTLEIENREINSSWEAELVESQRERLLFANVKRSLLAHDNFNFQRDLESYLTVIDKLEYLEVVNLLVDICTLKRDNLYYKVLMFLKELRLPNFNVGYTIKKYIYKLENELSENRRVALIYLEIIKRLNWGNSVILQDDINYLEDLLDCHNYFEMGVDNSKLAKKSFTLK
jgi:hypothetical protein